MSVWLKKVLLETAILGLLGAQGALAQPFGIDGLPPQARAGVVADSYIVTLEDGADPSDVSSFVAAVTGGHITQVYGTAINGFAIQVPPGLAIASVATAHPSIARVERDLTTRFQLYNRIERMIMDDAPWVTLWNLGEGYTLIKPNVKDYYLAPIVIPKLRYVYFSE